MKTVAINIYKDTDSLNSRIEVLIDGNTIGEGHIGGEPEDNSIYRDYSWIIPLLQSLSTSLGAQVITIEPDDEFDIDSIDLTKIVPWD